MAGRKKFQGSQSTRAPALSQIAKYEGRKKHRLSHSPNYQTNPALQPRKAPPADRAELDPAGKKEAYPKVGITLSNRREKIVIIKRRLES